jgi:hypothetical protein
MAIGVPVDGRTETAPLPTKEEMEARMQRARPLAAKCGMEMIAHHNPCISVGIASGAAVRSA